VDDTDRELLRALLADARTSWADLARQVGLSAPAVQERVRKLETFVVKVRVQDLADLDRTLRVLRHVPGVTRTRTTVVLDTPFEGRSRVP
jgi:Lrp/AsnC family leucine-responsive transcriptional regulator